MRTATDVRGRAYDDVAHQQAAMPEEYLQGSTIDPATWMRTSENRERLAARTRAADARRRAVEKEQPAPATDPAGPVGRRRQEHEQQRRQPGQGQGPGLEP
ncbi:hypothetical protein [Streptomyces daghestanicus]|uniref:Uncharacterized protein n=1 Tax=Streptomyces daghestanicus TaxID=66885 RepID=A0ABQ3Q7T7_9ACTN|nr:hypothetical protein [Streptomyces daghestanicus]GGU62658.1 hypothetical protein GCM10010259_61630 [Streptomyces daghestanicus]GHI33317.1 hypothetical protein Sdagh_50470 [Streptomyces daghestanicus]